MEWWWFQYTILQKEMTEADKQNVFWDILKKRDFAEKKLSVVECLNVVDHIRQQTTDILAKFNDTDLEKLFGYETDWSNGKHEASLCWILHHSIDHEAHHKGQIMMIKRIIK